MASPSLPKIILTDPENIIHSIIETLTQLHTRREESSAVKDRSDRDLEKRVRELEEALEAREHELRRVNEDLVGRLEELQLQDGLLETYEKELKEIGEQSENMRQEMRG